MRWNSLNVLEVNHMDLSVIVYVTLFINYGMETCDCAVNLSNGNGISTHNDLRSLERWTISRLLHYH